MKILFNDDVNEDIRGVLAFIEGIANDQSGKKLSFNANKIINIIQGMRTDFPHKDGISKASVFKKVANFAAYFISEKPIQSDIVSIANLDSDLVEIPNHVNTIVALMIVFTALHKAPIHMKDGTNKVLERPIMLSKHSYVDLVEALSTCAPNTHFQLLAVLFEQLAYKSNPDCQYQPFPMTTPTDAN